MGCARRRTSGATSTRRPSPWASPTASPAASTRRGSRPCPGGCDPPPESDPMMEVLNNQPAHRFELRVGEEAAFLSYRRSGTTINLVHTEVPDSLRGRGLGDQLARAALEHAREHGLTVIPTCPFVKAYLRKHPEYASLVAGG